MSPFFSRLLLVQMFSFLQEMRTSIKTCMNSNIGHEITKIVQNHMGMKRPVTEKSCMKNECGVDI